MSDPESVSERLSPLIESFVDSATDASVVLDRTLTAQHYNRAYWRLTGFRAYEMRTRKLQRLCCDHFRLETCLKDQCVAARAFAEGKSLRFDEVEAMDRGLRLIVTAVPIFAPGADTAHAVIETYRDVTAETRVQNNYRRLLERERRDKELLQEEVKKQTAELEQSLDKLKATRAQLIQSETMSSIGRLVAGIAHELNNPINFIYGNVQFLQDYVKRLARYIDRFDAAEVSDALRADLDEQARQLELDFIREDLEKLLPAIQSGAERIASIVRDLRSFSRVEDAASGPMDLNESITLTLNLVEPQAAHDVTIVRRLSNNLPLVMGNAAQIAQVLLNLVVNAIHAVGTRGVVTVRTSPGADNTVLLEVEDDGPGIPEDIIDKIFEPFFTTKEVGKGTGLGLSISYGIVERHRGRLTVESVPSKTLFRVALPRAAPDQA